VTDEEFKQLQPGDVVRHRGSSTSYVVTVNYGHYVVAVRTVSMSSPSEWMVVRPSKPHDRDASNDSPRTGGGGLLS
jgi:hypothetical protein